MNFFDAPHWDLPLWLPLLFTFLLGAIVGSFLNVCIYRLPFGDSIVRPRSRCPRCGRPIRPTDNIPILSWLLLGGRCRWCRGSIAVRYPLVELLTASLFAGYYWLTVAPEGPQLLSVEAGPAQVAGNLHLRYLYHLVLISCLIVATFIDFDYQVIPDAVTVPGMLVGIGTAVALPPLLHWTGVSASVAAGVHLVPAFVSADPEYLQNGILTSIPPWFAEHPFLHSAIVSLAGFLVGGGIIWAVRLIGSFALNREAMGFGDVTLMAMIGSFVGWQAAVLVFFFAPFCAILIALFQIVFRGQRAIPFGPYLSLSALLVLALWRPLWERTWPIFGLGLPLAIFAAGCVAMLGVLLVAWRIAQNLLGLAPDDGRHATSQGRHRMLPPMQRGVRGGSEPQDEVRFFYRSAAPASLQEAIRGGNRAAPAFKKPAAARRNSAAAQRSALGWYRHWQRRRSRLQATTQRHA